MLWSKKLIMVMMQMREKKEHVHSKRTYGDYPIAIPLKIAVFLIASAGFLSFSPGPAAGAGNIHIGQLEIHPFLSVSGTSSDNIYSTSTSTKPISDTIMTYTPGVKLVLPFGRHRAEARYYGTFTRYDEFTGEDTDDAHADGVLDFSNSGRFGLRFSGVYDKGHEARGSSSTGFIEEFRSGTGTGTITYRFVDRAKIQADYGRTSIDYIRPESVFRNRFENFSSFYFYYRFLPKTSAFLEVDWKEVAFKDALSSVLDSETISSFVGLSWEMTAKSRGSIKAGALSKDFKSTALDDFSTFAAAVDFRHYFSEYTTLTMIGQRTVNETTLTTSRYVLSTGGYAEIAHRFFRKLELALRGSFSTDEFSDDVPPVRKDETSMAGGGIKYIPRDWLEVGINYAVRKRESNLPENDYTENSYTASASIVF